MRRTARNLGDSWTKMAIKIKCQNIRKKAKIIAKKQTNEFDREKLLAIQGQELKYNKLCQALDVPTKVGNAKISQIDDLGCIAD